MTKKIAILAFLLYIAGTVSGQEFTFRGLPWGSTVEDIIAKEGQPDSISDSQLIYQNKNVAGYNAMLLFYLPPPRSDPYSEKYSLQYAYYTIGVTNVNSNIVYNDLLYKLAELYGTPTPGSKPELKSSDRYIYWIVSRTKISLTLLVDVKLQDVKGTIIFISYQSPDWVGNEFGNL